MWASAKATRLARFAGERGGFWRATLLLYPAERREWRTTYSPICQSSKWRASSKYVICLVFLDVLTKRISFCTCSGVSTGGLPVLCFRVTGPDKTYCTCLRVKLRWVEIHFCVWPALYNVCTISLWSLFSCFLCFGVLGSSILSVSREKCLYNKVVRS